MEKVEAQVKRPEPGTTMFPVHTIMVGKVRMHVYSVGKLHYLRFTYQDGRVRCLIEDILKHGVRIEDAMAVVGCAMGTLIMASPEAEKHQAQTFKAYSEISLKKMILEAFETMDKAKGRLGKKFEKEIKLKVRQNKIGKLKKGDNAKARDSRAGADRSRND